MPTVVQLHAKYPPGTSFTYGQHPPLLVTSQGLAGVPRYETRRNTAADNIDPTSSATADAPLWKVRLLRLILTAPFACLGHDPDTADLDALAATFLRDEEGPRPPTEPPTSRTAHIATLKRPRPRSPPAPLVELAGGGSESLAHQEDEAASGTDDDDDDDDDDDAAEVAAMEEDNRRIANALAAMALPTALGGRRHMGKDKSDDDDDDDDDACYDDDLDERPHPTHPSRRGPVLSAFRKDQRRIAKRSKPRDRPYWHLDLNHVVRTAKDAQSVFDLWGSGDEELVMLPLVCDHDHISEGIDTVVGGHADHVDVIEELLPDRWMPVLASRPLLASLLEMYVHVRDLLRILETHLPPPPPPPPPLPEMGKESESRVPGDEFFTWAARSFHLTRAIAGRIDPDTDKHHDQQQQQQQQQHHQHQHQHQGNLDDGVHHPQRGRGSLLGAARARLGQPPALTGILPPMEDQVLGGGGVATGKHQRFTDDDDTDQDDAADGENMVITDGGREETTKPLGGGVVEVEGREGRDQVVVGGWGRWTLERGVRRLRAQWTSWSPTTHHDGLVVTTVEEYAGDYDGTTAATSMTPHIRYDRHQQARARVARLARRVQHLYGRDDYDHDHDHDHDDDDKVDLDQNLDLPEPVEPPREIASRPERIPRVQKAMAEVIGAALAVMDELPAVLPRVKTLLTYLLDPSLSPNHTATSRSLSFLAQLGQITTTRGACTERVRRYFANRYRYFRKYDLGVAMDEEGWYSVTPEGGARGHAERLRQVPVIYDAFCGVGGNTTAFVQPPSPPPPPPPPPKDMEMDMGMGNTAAGPSGRTVVALDLDPTRLGITRHNVETLTTTSGTWWRGIRGGDRSTATVTAGSDPGPGTGPGKGPDTGTGGLPRSREIETDTSRERGVTGVIVPASTLTTTTTTATTVRYFHGDFLAPESTWVEDGDLVAGGLRPAMAPASSSASRSLPRPDVVFMSPPWGGPGYEKKVSRKGKRKGYSIYRVAPFPLDPDFGGLGVGLTALLERGLTLVGARERVTPADRGTATATALAPGTGTGTGTGTVTITTTSDDTSPPWGVVVFLPRNTCLAALHHVCSELQRRGAYPRYLPAPEVEQNWGKKNGQRNLIAVTLYLGTISRGTREEEENNGRPPLSVRHDERFVRTVAHEPPTRGEREREVDAVDVDPRTESNSGQGARTNVVPRKEGKPPIVVPHDSLRSVPFIALLSDMNREERATPIGVTMNKCTSVLFAAWRRCWAENQGDEEACLQAWNTKFGGNDKITSEIIEDVRNSFSPKSKGKKTGEALGESTRTG